MCTPNVAFYLLARLLSYNRRISDLSFQSRNKIPVRVLRYSSVPLTKYALRRGLLITTLTFCYAFFAKRKLNVLYEDHFPLSVHDLIKD